MKLSLKTQEMEMVYNAVCILNRYIAMGEMCDYDEYEAAAIESAEKKIFAAFKNDNDMGVYVWESQQK